MAQDWGNHTTEAEAKEPRNISDTVLADDRFDIRVSEGGKTLTGDISIYCAQLTEEACQGVANSMENINQTQDGYTIDLNVTVTSYQFLSDIKVLWFNPLGSKNGDSTRLGFLQGIFGAHNRIRLKHGLGYGANVKGLTSAHELGHALGLLHQNNSTNSLMSYNPTKTNGITLVQMKNLIKAYK